MEILEVRQGQYEISDYFCNEDRNRTKLIQNAIRFMIPISIFLAFLSIRISSLWLRILMIILFIAVSGGLIYLMYLFKDKLPPLLNGFVVDFTPEKKVNSIRVREWLLGSNNEFQERDVRFNQAIGFLARIDENGDIWAEIIVDPEFPGTPIFHTYDMQSLAELNHLFQEILPDLDRWVYRNWKNEDWYPELKDDLNEAIQNTRVPWQIRKYFDFKVQSWK